MSRWISSKGTSKIDTNYEMLSKSETYDMMVRMFRRSSRSPHCSARALRPSSPKLFLPRLTRVMALLTRKASARACRVGMMHMAKCTGDSWVFHCNCCVMHCQPAISHVWHKHTQGTCQDCGHVPNHVRSSCHHPAHSLLNTFVW